MKVCAYIMTYDTGLAPNPFHGVCTLAVCTPNHMHANLEENDFIIGIAGIDLCKKLTPPLNPWRLIYAMRVDEVMKLDDYYNSTDYKLKIPKLSGSKEEMCGDNFYKLSDEKILIHTDDSNEHDWPEVIKKDRYGNRVFIGRSFNYYGSLAPAIPQTSEWGRKLVNKFDKCAIGLRYIFGGRSNNLWAQEDFEDFKKFLNDTQIKGPPVPIGFDNWKSEPEKKSSCSGCS